MNILPGTYPRIRVSFVEELRALIVDAAKLEDPISINASNMAHVVCTMVDWAQALWWNIGHAAELMSSCGIDRGLLMRIEHGATSIGVQQFFSDHAGSIPRALSLTVDVSLVWQRFAQIVHEMMLERIGIASPFFFAATTPATREPLYAHFQAICDMAGWVTGALCAMGINSPNVVAYYVSRKKEGAEEFARLACPVTPKELRN